MNKNTSWQNVNKWYAKSVGKRGHYYHKNVVIPKALKLLDLSKNDSVLDLACGQGVFARHLQTNIRYLGIDASAALIQEAKKLTKSKLARFDQKNLSLPIMLSGEKFSVAVCLLAAQNIENLGQLFQNANRHLFPDGKFLIVLNHPCFRIPRHSSWDFDEKGNIMYRKVDQYMSDLRIPILLNPSEGKNSQTTLSFHRPLSAYIRTLANNNFCLIGMEEWISDKESAGKRARPENTAREEIPLFMALLAQKRTSPSLANNMQKT